MCDAVPDCLVTNYEPLEQMFAASPDAGDAHVMAAAMKAQAQVIVTKNLKHFPVGLLEPWGIEAKHPTLWNYTSRCGICPKLSGPSVGRQ